MKKIFDYTKFISTANLKRLAILSGSLVILLIIYFVVIPFALRIIYSGGIPEQPDFRGYPSAVTEYLKNEYAEALREPYSDEKVGRLAMAYHANFFYESAEACYRTAINLNEDEWLWYYYLALLKEELGDAEAAAGYLKQVIELNPAVTHAWFRLGNSRFKLNMYDEAEAAFRKVIGPDEFIYDSGLPDKGAFPLNAYARLNLARVDFLRQETGKAESELHNLLKDFPRFGPAYRMLGRIYTAEGDMAKGEEYETTAGDFDSYLPPSDPVFNKLVLYSRNSHFILKQIDIARRSENYEWAEMLCKHILDYDPSDIEAITKYIMVMLDTHHYQELGDKLQLYYKHYTDDEGQLTNMAETLYRWNQYQSAVKFLERAITVNPKAVEAHVLYLKILVAGKKDEAALKHCEKALAVNKNNADLLTEYGRILYLNGRGEEARKHFNEALRADPSNEVTLILMGIMSKEQGKTGAAINYFRRSIDANPLNVNTILILINYLIELRRWDEAHELIVNSLKDSPNSIELLERYSTLLAACPDASVRNEKKALELARRISNIRKESPDQEIRCAITLGMAYAAVGDYNTAAAVMKNVYNRSGQLRVEKYLPKIEALTELFRSQKPYRL